MQRPQELPDSSDRNDLSNPSNPNDPNDRSRRNGIESLIGNTPLCQIHQLHSKPGVRVLAKMEGNNPAGSVKDRAVLSMFCEAERRGEIGKGSRLVEATSGNTGIALAMIAAIKGYEMELVMPENSTKERVDTMRAYGAKITLTAADAGMEGAIDYARAKVERDGYYSFDQFGNPANPLAHYQGTGPEIWRDTKGSVSHFVSAMGTTGTIMGVSQYLKEQNPKVRIVGVQPDKGSSIPGIRSWPAEYLPKIYQPQRIDELQVVSRAEAVATTRALAQQEGILAGMSSGGAVCVALRIAAELTSGTVVVIICDRGDRYLSSDLFG